jgi:hypothetical protein
MFMKETIMRTLILAAATLALSTTTYAAPPGFCERYARDAVHEFRADTHIPFCFKGENARWHDNYDAHFGWCLRVSIDAANAERDYRRTRLYECRARLHY